MFEPGVSLGNILTILTFIVGGMAFVYSLRADTRVQEAKFMMLTDQMIEVKIDVKKLSEVLVQLATHGGRITSVEERLLSQGRRLDENIARVNRFIDKEIERSNRDAWEQDKA